MSPPEEAEPKQETNADALSKALELELIMKRASWQKMRARRGSWRALSFLFLFLVLLGALATYFYFGAAVRQPATKKSAAQSVEANR